MQAASPASIFRLSLWTLLVPSLQSFAVLMIPLPSANICLACWRTLTP